MGNDRVIYPGVKTAIIVAISLFLLAKGQEWLPYHGFRLKILHKHTVLIII